MSDWEEASEDYTSPSENSYIPPQGRGWYGKPSNDGNFSERRPGFGRGRANRFGNATDNRNDTYNTAQRNEFQVDSSSRGYGRGGGGFGRVNRDDSNYSRGAGENRSDNFGRGGGENGFSGSWRDRGNRESSGGFGRSRGGQGREKNSTEMMVPSDEIRFIIGWLLLLIHIVNLLTCFSFYSTPCCDLFKRILNVRFGF